MKTFTNIKGEISPLRATKIYLGKDLNKVHYNVRIGTKGYNIGIDDNLDDNICFKDKSILLDKEYSLLKVKRDGEKVVDNNNNDIFYIKDGLDTGDCLFVLNLPRKDSFEYIYKDSTLLGETITEHLDYELKHLIVLIEESGSVHVTMTKGTDIKYLSIKNIDGVIYMS